MASYGFSVTSENFDSYAEGSNSAHDTHSEKYAGLTQVTLYGSMVVGIQ